MTTPASPSRALPSGESADRDPLLGNEYLLGSPDRKKGPHCLFTFLSIDAVIAAHLTPDQLPRSIHDTPPRRLVMSYHGIIESVKPEPFLSLNHGANMRYDPRWSKLFDMWGKPVFGDYKFPLPKLPERRRRGEREGMRSGRAGLETEVSMPRNGKDEVGKGKVARGDGYEFDKYRELPSVAAHTAWCARNDARVESGDSGKGYEFERYRELPSIVAHGAWCARTSTGDDDHHHGDGINNEDRGGGYSFDKYSELSSVLAHGAWCKRTEDGDGEETEKGDDEETEKGDDQETKKGDE